MNMEKKYKKHSYQAGQAYGRLILTGRNFMKAAYGRLRRFVEADCICGVSKWYSYDALTKGETKSCGCLQRELLAKRRTTHGMSNHPLYSVYRGMLERCYDKRNISYPRYGGRGITVCEEWRLDPQTFFDWAIENGWQQGLEVDRRENNGIYEPSNCRFVTPSVNGKNRRSNRLITAFGETKCLMDWANDSRCKISFKRLWARLNEGYWNSVEEMITTPPKIRGKNLDNRADKRMVTAFGEEKSLEDWLKDSRCIVDENRVRQRIRKGWDAEKSMITKQRKLPRLLLQPAFDKVEVNF